MFGFTGQMARFVVAMSWIACGLGAGQVSAAAPTEILSISPPAVDGDRAIRFTVRSTQYKDQDLSVMVYYAATPDRVNAPSAATPRGRPVLKTYGSRPAGTTGMLDAIFVLPHPDFPKDANRALYVRELKEKLLFDTVSYVEVEQQLVRGNLYVPAPFRELPEDSPIDLAPTVFDFGDCVYYRIEVMARGKVVASSALLSFNMPDAYVIGVAGDSYASGEGAPDVPLSPNAPAAWLDPSCHRSGKSGLRLGVKEFIRRTPEVAVDYAHVACSAAWIADLRRSQFAKLDEVLLERRQHREVHQLLLSIGGNNAGFADYFANYFVLPFGNVVNDPQQPGLINAALDKLADSYAELDGTIEDRFPAASVTIANYPDPTEGPFGTCATPVLVLGLLPYACVAIELKNEASWRFTRNKFIQPLNDRILGSARAHGWRVVDVEAEFGSHGYCNCADPYMTTLASTFVTQGDHKGAAHPNAAGYRRAYKQPVADALGAAYRKFFKARSAALLMLSLTGQDSPYLAAACPAAKGLSVLRPLSTYRELVELSRVHPLLQELAADPETVRMIEAGDLPGLQKHPSYRTFTADAAVIDGIIDEGLPFLPKPAHVSRPERLEPPASVRLRAAQVEQYLRTRPAPRDLPIAQRPVDAPDPLERRFERP